MMIATLIDHDSQWGFIRTIFFVLQKESSDLIIVYQSSHDRQKMYRGIKFFLESTKNRL